MMIIKKLSKMIKEEICDADKYANLAMKYKDEDRTLADTFYNLANEELKHMEQLHTQVVRLINARKSTDGAIPEGMQLLYDYIHEEQMDAVREVKVTLGMYKGA